LEGFPRPPHAFTDLLYGARNRACYCTKGLPRNVACLTKRFARFASGLASFALRANFAPLYGLLVLRHLPAILLYGLLDLLLLLPHVLNSLLRTRALVARLLQRLLELLRERLLHLLQVRN
jgi:hypothetical protein